MRQKLEIDNSSGVLGGGRECMWFRKPRDGLRGAPRGRLFLSPRDVSRLPSVAVLCKQRPHGETPACRAACKTAPLQSSPRTGWLEIPRQLETVGLWHLLAVEPSRAASPWLRSGDKGRCVADGRTPGCRNVSSALRHTTQGTQLIASRWKADKVRPWGCFFKAKNFFWKTLPL